MKVDLARFEEAGYEVSFCDGALVSMRKQSAMTDLSSSVQIHYLYMPGIYRMEAEVTSPDGIVKRWVLEAPLCPLMREVDRTVYGRIEAYISGATNIPEIREVFRKYRRKAEIV